MLPPPPTRSTMQRLGPSIVWFGLSGVLFAVSVLWALHTYPLSLGALHTSSSLKNTGDVTAGTRGGFEDNKGDHTGDDTNPSSSSSYYTDDPATIASITLFILGERYSQLAAASLVLSFAWLLFQCCTLFSLGPLRPLEDAGIIKELQERLITNFSFRLLVLLVIISDIVFLHSWVLPFSWYTAITGLFALSLMSKRRFELFMQENNQYHQHPTNDNLALVSSVSRSFIITPGSNLRTILRQHLSRLFILFIIMILNMGLLMGLVIGLGSSSFVSNGGSFHLLILLMADNVSIILKTLHTSTIYLTYLYTASTNHPYSNTSLSTIEAWRRDITEYADIFFDGGSVTVQLLHLLHIWYLHGLSFSLVDMVLLLNVKSCINLLGTRWKAFSSYYKLNKQLDALCVDASIDQLRTKRKPDTTEKSPSTSVSNTHNASDGLRYRGDKPVEEDSTVKKPPTKINKNDNDDDADDYEYEECAICLETMLQAKRLPVCGHMFHRHCLRGWLLAPSTTATNRTGTIPAHRTCPLCRTAIDPQDIEIQRRQQQQDTRTTANNNNNNTNNNNNRPRAANNLVDNMINHPLWTHLGFTFAGEDTSIDQDFQTLTEMFPHVAPQALRQHRTVSGNIHLTIDAALRGILPAQPNVSPPAVPSTTRVPSPQDSEDDDTLEADTADGPELTIAPAVASTIVPAESGIDVISSTNLDFPSSISSITDDNRHSLSRHSSDVDQGLASILAVTNATPRSLSTTIPVQTLRTSSTISTVSVPTSGVSSPVVVTSPSINSYDALSPEDKRTKEREIRARAAEARLQRQ